jgi:branched-chain amino acid transport system ATP-binding protein
MLDVRDLKSGYGKIGVLHGVSLHVGAGEVVALLGPNGAGKTTLLRAISGLLPWSAGDVVFDGRSLAGMGPRNTARAGLAHAIEGHRVFTQQTVHDNLLLAAYDAPRAERGARIEEALATFPEISAKRNTLAGALSGGQRQMLVVAQGLVKRPRFLMLDEPSAGLAPVLVDRVLDVVADLSAKGVAILLVEQMVEKALARASRVYAMAQGRLVMESPAGVPGLAARIEQVYFGHKAA